MSIDIVAFLQSIWSMTTIDDPRMYSLTLLDYACLIVLGIFGLDGIRRGLILGVLDIFAFVASISAAVAFGGHIGARIYDRIPISQVLATSLGSIGMFLIAQMVYALGASMIIHAVAPWARAITPVRMLNTFLGGVPGFIKGTMVLAVLSSTLHMLPMASEVRKLLSESIVINRTVPLGATIVPEVSNLLARMGNNSTPFAPPPLSTVPRSNAIQFPTNVNSNIDLVTEVQMLVLINRERANAGVAPLAADETLQTAARDHSMEMFRLGYFAHESPTAGSPFDRMAVAGAQFSMAGENLAYAPNVETAHRGLMNSPGHRENILRSEYRRVGIGVAKSVSGVTMFTQNFSD